MTCPHCHSHDLVEIRMQLHDETVTMHSCQACERRWWDRDGGPSACARSSTWWPPAELTRLPAAPEPLTRPARRGMTRY